MKLLYDANLSPALVTHLHPDYPGSRHVRDIGLRAGTDRQIWDRAKADSFVIVWKDTDFRERGFIEGFRQRSHGWTYATPEPWRSRIAFGLRWRQWLRSCRIRTRRFSLSPVMDERSNFQMERDSSESFGPTNQT